MSFYPFMSIGDTMSMGLMIAQIVGQLLLQLHGLYFGVVACLSRHRSSGPGVVFEGHQAKFTYVRLLGKITLLQREFAHISQPLLK